MKDGSAIGDTRRGRVIAWQKLAQKVLAAQK
jgi:hypothetical protein